MRGKLIVGGGASLSRLGLKQTGRNVQAGQHWARSRARQKNQQACQDWARIRAWQKRAGLSRLGPNQSNAAVCRPVKTGPEGDQGISVQAALGPA